MHESEEARTQCTEKTQRAAGGSGRCRATSVASMAPCEKPARMNRDSGRPVSFCNFATNSITSLRASSAPCVHQPCSARVSATGYRVSIALLKSGRACRRYGLGDLPRQDGEKHCVEIDGPPHASRTRSFHCHHRRSPPPSPEHASEPLSFP